MVQDLDLSSFEDEEEEANICLMAYTTSKDKENVNVIFPLVFESLNFEIYSSGFILHFVPYSVLIEPMRVMLTFHKKCNSSNNPLKSSLSLSTNQFYKELRTYSHPANHFICLAIGAIKSFVALCSLPPTRFLTHLASTPNRESQLSIVHSRLAILLLTQQCWKLKCSKGYHLLNENSTRPTNRLNKESTPLFYMFLPSESHLLLNEER
ncbi:hypothetical protein CR513_30622, partial [Mucuna pruriens]